MAATGIFKNAIKKDVGNSFTTIYETPSSKTSYVIQLDISSVSNSGVQVSVRVKDTSQGVGGTSAFLVKNAPIPVGSAIQVIDGQKIVLEATDLIEVKCDTTGSTVDVIMSLIEDV
ncbi:hypothetical protein UFOVP410_181 [uncultured Caudovirales phage]|uniref:Virion structural protein n=1 Tax=uncultured Caudovirales phage TaxID=2100421 RepID=A0A6J5M599_9CAUD|nr:hypothetical protein UFOVP410_181 [uncultured Caudovirales phage]